MGYPTGTSSSPNASNAPGTQTSYVEGDMTNVEIRAALSVFTQLMTNQDQVVTNHVVAKANLEVYLNPMQVLSLLVFWIS